MTDIRSFSRHCCGHAYVCLGDDCEGNFDGCAADPCSLGRNCTDHDPEQHNATGESHTCSDCPPGYVDDGTQCADIDECDTGDDNCEHNCTNTDGGFTCTCRDGFRPRLTDYHLCDDINECDEALHDCQHLCENTHGGYECSCYAGYVFNATMNECIAEFDPDDTPCDRVGLNCSFAHDCRVEEEAAVSCLCEDGYHLSDDGTECIDTNECEGQLCDMTCENTDGSFTCGCLTGYKLQDAITCQQCEPPLWGDNCDNVCECSAVGTLECNHVRGCVCKEGWTGDQCSEDIDECKTNLTICGNVRKECKNAEGSYECTCIKGYEAHEGDCRDIDECADPTKNHCEQTCSNTVGGYVCGCKEGFTKNGTYSCSDIDECESRGMECQHLCVNYPGLYTCSCYFGFILKDDRTKCRKDFNPCEGYTNISCSHICIVNNSVAECKCPAGYELGKDGSSCTDIDECKTGNPCSGDAICNNIAGSYICRCPLGLKLENDGRTCTECDEYHFGENCEEVCSCLNGRCDKIKGCICDDGWTGDNCDQDINECLTTPELCPGENEICQNVYGSYKCVCRDGFLNTSGVCEDINECADKRSHNCHQVCNNIPGSFYCSCRKGFLMEGGLCRDIDECKGTNDCDYKCINTQGNYRCSCSPGFNLNPVDKRTCSPAKPCNDTEKANCSESADCFVEDGTPHCICRKGFTGDGSQCSDIEECDADVSPCMHECIEEKGGFHCKCYIGYRLDNDLSSCTECDQGRFGNNCDTNCSCIEANTKHCDPVNGTCECKTGWNGTDCDVDIDECKTATATCPEDSDCVNTNGTYLCKCNIGYVMTSAEVCKACDKRHFGENCASPCTCNTTTTASCDKVNGSCSCLPGWEGDDCSFNIDECDEKPDPCLDKNNSDCVDTEGSYRCVCKDGYIEQSGQCEDIDECLDKDTQIECTTTEFRQCVNEPGSYRCECRPGFSGDGVSCTACTGNRYGKNCSATCPCDKYKVTNNEQTCDTKTGTCRCNDKWTGKQCEDNVNECLADDACPLPNMGCINIDDGFECDCLVGFENKTGGACTPVQTPTPVKGTTKILTATLGIKLPPDTNLNVRKTFDAVKRDTEESLTQYFIPRIKGKFSVNVTGLRNGSLIVDYIVLLEDEETDGANLFQAVTELSLGSTVEFRNQTVNITADSFGDTTDQCTTYYAVFGECERGFRCVIKGNIPTCRKSPDHDNFALSVGLGVGVPLFALTLVLLLVCARLSAAKKRQRLHKKYGHVEPERREPRKLNRTVITKKEVKKLKKTRTTGRKHSDRTEPLENASRPNFSRDGWDFYFGKKRWPYLFGDQQHFMEPKRRPMHFWQIERTPPWETNEANKHAGMGRTCMSPNLDDFEPRKFPKDPQWNGMA